VIFGCLLSSSYEVTRKDRLFKNIQRMQQLKVTFLKSFFFSIENDKAWSLLLSVCHVGISSNFFLSPVAPSITVVFDPHLCIIMNHYIIML